MMRVATEIMGAFHLTKMSENSSSILNGIESLRKLVTRILKNLLRFSLFWKFRNKISCAIWNVYRYTSALVPLAARFCLDKSRQDGNERTLYWMQNDLPQFEFFC